MRYISLLVTLLLCAASVHGAHAQSVFTDTDFAPTTRGGKLVLRVSGEQDLELYRDSYALVVGVSQYRNGWPRLEGVKEDIDAVADALRKNGFRVGLVKDPTLAQLDRVFSEFINRYGLQPQNRLLFYFAGHGHSLTTADGRTMGYLVPVDAPLPSEEYPRDFIVRAMPMDQIEVYAKRVQAKHALFMFDACFAGTVFDTLRAAPPASIRYQVARPVRQFITSGSAGEPVPDRSLFRRQFISALEGDAAPSGDGYLTGEELGRFLQDTVTNYSQERQHPQYGKIRQPELDRGDFVFEIPARKAQAVATGGKARLTLNALPEAQLKINGHAIPDFPLIDRELNAGVHRVSFESTNGTLEKSITLRAGENLGCTAFFDQHQVECRPRE